MAFFNKATSLGLIVLCTFCRIQKIASFRPFVTAGDGFPSDSPSLFLDDTKAISSEFVQNNPKIAPLREVIKGGKGGKKGHGGEKGVKSVKGHGGKVSSKGSRHASSSPSLRPTKYSKETMILKSKKHKGGENESSKGKGEVSPKGGNSKSKSKGKGKGAVSSKSKNKGSKREGPQSKGAKGKGESPKRKGSGSKIKGSKAKGSKTSGKKIHGSAGKPAASPLKLVVPTFSKSPTISGATTDSSSASDYPSLSPGSTEVISVSPYYILYSLPSGTDPTSQEVDEVASLTAEYLHSFLVQHFANNPKTDFDEAATVMVESTRDVLGPWRITYDSATSFSPLSNFIPDQARLNGLIQSSFRGENMDKYKAFLKEALSTSSPFALSSDDAQFSFKSGESPSSSEFVRSSSIPEVANSSSMVGLASVASAAAGVLAVAGVAMYMRKKQGSSSETNLMKHIGDGQEVESNADTAMESADSTKDWREGSPPMVNVPLTR